MRDFRLLWAGQSCSFLGSSVSEIALPLLAVITLHCGPAQLGLLTAAQFAPYLLLALPAGAWIDRSAKRPILLAANFGRAAIFAVVPLLYVADALRIEWLYLIAFAAGILTVGFDIAYQAQIPALVPAGELVRANSRLAVSETTADVGGPGIAGLLVQAAGAPAALALDAASFLVAGFTVAAMRPHEPARQSADDADRGLAAIRAGLRATLGDARLRAVTAEAAMYNFFQAAVLASVALFFTRELGLSPAVYGIVFTVGSVGAIIGSLSVGFLVKRFGVGHVLAAAAVVGNASYLLIALADGPMPLVVAAVTLGVFGDALGSGISDVLAAAIRQAAAPPGMLGRVSASSKWLTLGALPLGALAGGLCGAKLGLRPTMVIAACGILLAAGWLLIGPVRRLRELPASR